MALKNKLEKENKMANDTERKTVLGILKKMGVDHSTKISKDRAIKKLHRTIDKGVAVPTNLTEEEKAALTELGIKVPKEKKEEKKSVAKTSKNGALTYCKEQWKVRDEWGRTDIVETLKKMFGEKAQWAAANYIARAKKDKELLGALLTEEKTEDGAKILRK